MNENTPAKWLRYLMYIHLVSIANSVIGWLPVSGTLTTWVSRLIGCAVILCMLKLQQFSSRYRKAAMYRALMLACLMIGFFESVIPALLGTVFSFLAVYQEYSGHSDLTAPLDAGLSQTWHSFFAWSIGASLLISFATSAVALLVFAANTQAPVVQSITMASVELIQLAVDGFYLWYLIRTIRLFEPET